MMLNLNVDHPAQDHVNDPVLHARITVAVASVFRNTDRAAIVTEELNGTVYSEHAVFSEPPHTRTVTRERGIETPLSRMDYYQEPDGPRLWVSAHSRWHSVFFHDSLTGRSLGETVDELERFAQRVDKFEVPGYITGYGVGSVVYFPRAPHAEDRTRPFKIVNLMFPWMFLALDDGELWQLTREQYRAYGMTKTPPTKGTDR